MRQHIIKRLVFRLNFADRAQARRLEHEVINIYRHHLEPSLDECFSELAGSDTEYRVDRLELDLGRIKPQKLRTDMPLRFAQQLRKHTAGGLSRTAEIISEQDREFTLFRHFIETGRLPWWAGTVSRHTLEELVENLCIKSPARLRGMIPVVLRDGIKTRRLVNQLSDGCLSRLTGLNLPPHDVEVIAQQHADIETLFAELDRQDSSGGVHASRRPVTAAPESRHTGSPGSRTVRRVPAPDLNPGRIKLREHYWRLVLSGCADGPGNRFNSAALLQDTLVALTANSTAVYRSLLARLAGAVRTLAHNGHQFSADPTGLIEKLISTDTPEADIPAQSRTDKPAAAGQAVGTGSGNPAASPAAARQDSEQALTNAAQEVVRAGSKPAEEWSADPDEDYVENAGLVILWPYLPRLFLNLGLAHEHNFIHAEAAERAVLLLQYLVKPEPEIPESLLSLNKLLCGLELNRPFPTEFSPTEREQGECDALFGALKLHWNVLANMSVDRIRTDFLQRQGILRPCSGNWQLNVENQALDILMKDLPWPIGVVKLPWMDYAVLVHWG